MDNNPTFNYRIFPVFNPSLTHNRAGWSFFLHQVTDLTSHRIPVTSYVAPDLDDLANYIRLLNPGRHYVLPNLHGESLLFCSTCRWTFQNYITETCDQCKAPIQ